MLVVFQASVKRRRRTDNVPREVCYHDSLKKSLF
jgi:hypothetical protein